MKSRTVTSSRRQRGNQQHQETLKYKLSVNHDSKSRSDEQKASSKRLQPSQRGQNKHADHISAQGGQMTTTRNRRSVKKPTSTELTTKPWMSPAVQKLSNQLGVSKHVKPMMVEGPGELRDYIYIFIDLFSFKS